MSFIVSAPEWVKLENGALLIVHNDIANFLDGAAADLFARRYGLEVRELPTNPYTSHEMRNYLHERMRYEADGVVAKIRRARKRLHTRIETRVRKRLPQRASLRPLLLPEEHPQS